MKQKTTTMKKSTTASIEAYAVKLCPHDVQADLCSFGLPMFVRDRTTAINEACLMLNHMNIKSEIARLRFLGRYDNVGGLFIAPRPVDFYDKNLAEALAEVTKGDNHEEK